MASQLLLLTLSSKPLSVLWHLLGLRYTLCRRVLSTCLATLCSVRGPRLWIKLWAVGLSKQVLVSNVHRRLLTNRAAVLNVNRPLIAVVSLNVFPQLRCPMLLTYPGPVVWEWTIWPSLLPNA